MEKLIIEGDSKKIKKLRKELKLKVERNGLTFKEDKPVKKKTNGEKEIKKKVIKD